MHERDGSGGICDLVGEAERLEEERASQETGQGPVTEALVALQQAARDMADEAERAGADVDFERLGALVGRVCRASRRVDQLLAERRAAREAGS